MLKSPINFLHHILDECEFITTNLSDCDDYDAFFGDEVLKRAIVRSLEIIGEATKNITADYKVKWSTIKWKEMAGMRDRLIHDYVGVSYKIVWDVAKNKIPILQEQITFVIETERPKFNQ